MATKEIPILRSRFDVDDVSTLLSKPTEAQLSDKEATRVSAKLAVSKVSVVWPVQPLKEDKGSIASRAKFSPRGLKDHSAGTLAILQRGEGHRNNATDIASTSSGRVQKGDEARSMRSPESQEGSSEYDSAGDETALQAEGDSTNVTKEHYESTISKLRRFTKTTKKHKLDFYKADLALNWRNTASRGFRVKKQSLNVEEWAFKQRQLDMVAAMQVAHEKELTLEDMLLMAKELKIVNSARWNVQNEIEEVINLKDECSKRLKEEKVCRKGLKKKFERSCKEKERLRNLVSSTLSSMKTTSLEMIS